MSTERATLAVEVVTIGDLEQGDLWRKSYGDTAFSEILSIRREVVSGVTYAVIDYGTLTGRGEGRFTLDLPAERRPRPLIVDTDDVPDAGRWAVADPRIAGADEETLTRLGIPHVVTDYEGDLRACFHIHGDAERYCRERNREREAGFVLSIGLGNAAMNEAEHVGQALEELAQAIADGERAGNVFDENGNMVGHWSLVEPLPPTVAVLASDLEVGQRVKIGDTFERIETTAPMPGGRIEIITEPYGEGYLVEASAFQDVLDEDR